MFRFQDKCDRTVVFVSPARFADSERYKIGLTRKF